MNSPITKAAAFFDFYLLTSENVNVYSRTKSHLIPTVASSRHLIVFMVCTCPRCARCDETRLPTPVLCSKPTELLHRFRK